MVVGRLRKYGRWRENNGKKEREIRKREKRNTGKRKNQ